MNRSRAVAGSRGPAPEPGRPSHSIAAGQLAPSFAKSPMPGRPLSRAPQAGHPDRLSPRPGGADRRRGCRAPPAPPAASATELGDATAPARIAGARRPRRRPRRETRPGASERPVPRAFTFIADLLHVGIPGPRAPRVSSATQSAAGSPFPSDAPDEPQVYRLYVDRRVTGCPPGSVRVQRIAQRAALPPGHRYFEIGEARLGQDRVVTARVQFTGN